MPPIPSPQRRTPRTVAACAALPLAALAAVTPAMAQDPTQDPTRGTTQATGGDALMGQVDREQPVALVADKVTYDNASGLLVAEGSVEVYYGERTLTARRIVYDSRNDRISAEGEITIRNPDGATLVADFADLDANLRDGLVRGARASLDEHARFAALEARRVDNRFNVLSRAVFSPCAVCPEDPIPLWRIRARRIVHDEQEKIIHYEDATFDVLGVPVAYTPYFSHPDPTLGRSSGFLMPEYLQSTTFGLAVKTPYYWVIDDKSDATIKPFVTTGDGLIMEGEYRRAFRNGALRLSGSAAYDDYDGEDRMRGHIFAQSLFDLGGGFETGFNIARASDDAYLRRYEFTEDDRLTSEMFLHQGDSQGYGELSFVHFQSLRDDEPSGQIPTALPTFEVRRDWDEDILGGVFGIETAGYALNRTAGQDTMHLSLGADWEKEYVHSTGLTFGAAAEARMDWWRVFDASTDDTDPVRFGPQAMVEARYPLVRRDAPGGLFGFGVTHVIEPIAQAVVAPYIDDTPGLPDEDSQITEFDETNLFTMRRHSGWDGFEEGPRLNLGLRYSALTDDGSSFSTSFGRVFRTREIDSFAGGEGLNKRDSDFVGAWTLFLPGTLKLSNRVRVADDFELRRNEFYISTDWSDLQLNGYYIYLAADEVTPEDRQETAASARYALTPNWFIGGDARRDLETNSWVRVSGNIAYRDECVDLEFYGGRRFTRSQDVPPSTFFGVRVRLWALGGGGGAAPVAGACKPVIR